jgi:hypothetical protein
MLLFIEKTIYSYLPVFELHLFSVEALHSAELSGNLIFCTWQSLTRNNNSLKEI